MPLRIAVLGARSVLAGHRAAGLHVGSWLGYRLINDSAKGMICVTNSLK